LGTIIPLYQLLWASDPPEKACRMPENTTKVCSLVMVASYCIVSRYWPSLEYGSLTLVSNNFVLMLGYRLSRLLEIISLWMQPFSNGRYT
jgi:hypothetical protein